MRIELLDLPQDKIYVKLGSNFIKTAMAKIKKKYVLNTITKFYGE